MDQATPRQIVQALDRYIVGQADAKRAVAVAVRNRWRRMQLSAALRNDVLPKNILMVGPTGVGKTEIARRLAQLLHAPFVKVEATSFTEVGYYGRDVESIVRDLVERALTMEREAAWDRVRAAARRSAEDHILDQLLPHAGEPSGDPEQRERRQRAREKLRSQLQAGGLNEHTVDVTVDEAPASGFMLERMGLGHMGPEFEQMMQRVWPARSRRQRLPVQQALEVLLHQESDRLVDQEALQQTAIARAEQAGIVFVDEIDKICGTPGGEMGGPEVSRSGVQRDLLPLVEGTSITTRYGPVRTDHVLFIAAGAFTQASPGDLMPELQGRFPIRVELDDLTAEDYHRILTEPQNALIRQQVELLRTEGVTLTFTPDALVEMADMAYKANEMLENIGARRLYTIVEKVVEDIAFHASDAVNKTVNIDVDYVRMRLADVLEDKDRSEFEL